MRTRGVLCSLLLPWLLPSQPYYASLLCSDAMPAVDLSEFRLIRVEYDPYEQGLEEDEEYDFDFEPDPDQLYIRVRAFWKFIASKTSQRSNSLREAAH